MTNLTDLLDPQGNASRVLIRYADRLLVVQHRDLHYPLSLDDNGATWSDDPMRLWDWHREVAAGHAAAIAGSDAAANEIRAATGYLRRARTLLGCKRMVGAVGPAFLHMQNSEDIPPGLTVCQGEDLDRDPLYLGCANGVVDLNVGRLLPPEEGRRQLISRNTGVSFDPEARDGSVDDLLALLSEPESRHLLAALGHALRGRSPGRWYVLCGEPGSGKTVLLRTIADALGIVQSGGYAFFPPDRLMISGRHTSTTSFADHLREFTRGRVALVDGLPVMGANFNLGLVKTLISEGHLGRWNEHNMDGVPTPVTATIFQALRPEDIDQLDLSDPALADRTHVLSYLPLQGRTIGDGPASVPITDQARQAMLALLVQHAAANREPPDAPASVTLLPRERHRASIGAVGRWLVDHLQVTGEGDEIILADEIMAALAEDIPPDAQARFRGRTRREILHLARYLIQGFPTARRVKRGEQLLFAYPGLRLLTTADIHPAGAALPADIEARRAGAAETPAAYTLGYCRACRILLLEILQQHHLTWHTEEELRRQHPCFRCETLLPAGDPFQLVCADCAGKPREDLETQTAVMTAIAAEMVEPAEGMAAHLQAQIDRVHQFLHQKINAEKAEEEEEENGGG